MRRNAKITAARLPLRKTAAGAAAVRRSFPLWGSADHGLSVPTSPLVTARVRDALVLRAVASSKPKRVHASFHVRGGR